MQSANEENIHLYTKVYHSDKKSNSSMLHDTKEFHYLLVRCFVKLNIFPDFKNTYDVEDINSP